jgi:hypothetical protein
MSRLMSGDKYYADCPLMPIVVQMNEQKKITLTGFPGFPQSELDEYLTPVYEKENPEPSKWKYVFLYGIQIFASLVPLLNKIFLPPLTQQQRLAFNLGLNINASEKQIKDSCNRIKRTEHPDKFGSIKKFRRFMNMCSRKNLIPIKEINGQN